MRAESIPVPPSVSHTSTPDNNNHNYVVSVFISLKSYCHNAFYPHLTIHNHTVRGMEESHVRGLQIVEENHTECVIKTSMVGMVVRSSFTHNAIHLVRK